MVTDFVMAAISEFGKRPGQGYYESRDQTLTFGACPPHFRKVHVVGLDL